MAGEDEEDRGEERRLNLKMGLKQLDRKNKLWHLTTQTAHCRPQLLLIYCKMN